jgi:hypothetical protein
LNLIKFSYKKKQHKSPSKKQKRGKKLSPRNRKACHSVSIALKYYCISNNAQNSGEDFPGTTRLNQTKRHLHYNERREAINILETGHSDAMHD